MNRPDPFREPFQLHDRLVRPDLNRISRPDGPDGAETAVQVEPRVMAVLLALAEQPGAVVTRLDLLDTVWRDTVEFGTMIRQVRGPGTLIPEQTRWITAVTAGRIEQIMSLPGTEVGEGALIMRMSNPDVDMQLLTARQQQSQAEAALAQLRVNIAHVVDHAKRTVTEERLPDAEPVPVANRAAHHPS